VHITLLQVQGLHKTYRIGKSCAPALQGVSFTVHTGEIVALLGSNGAGKTTCVKCILGLVLPDSGQITVCGYDPIRQPRLALPHIGAVLEGNRNIYWQLSAWENLLFFAGVAGVPPAQARRRAGELLERLGLAHRAHELVGGFSRGMQQKVALAVALIREPRLLLLDEPTLGLDVEAARDLRHALRALADSGRGILLCTHQMELVEQLADRVLILHKGTLAREGSPDELRAAFGQRAFVITTAQPLSETLQHAIRAQLPEATLDGRVITLRAHDARSLYTLMRLLEAEQVPIESVQTVVPRLEEVFLEVARQP
jgi:ABC-2 type transport system ATP-binding protein